ncbi:MAG: hypothetical protein LBC13_00445 [Clostridiales bacterium]|nr:hypothetical protein [Clostridiales bacterium]
MIGILWAAMALILTITASFAIRTYLKMPRSDTLFNKASAAFSQKKFERAAELFARALAVNRFRHANKSSCLISLAFIRVEMHDAEGARFYAESALLENPDSAAAREILGKLSEI